VLVLDEPTDGMDIAGEAGIMELISDLHRGSGLTILMISHSLNLVAEPRETIDAHHGDEGVFRTGMTDELLNGETLKDVYRLSVDVHSFGGRKFLFAHGRANRGRRVVMDFVRSIPFLSNLFLVSERDDFLDALPILQMGSWPPARGARERLPGCLRHPQRIVFVTRRSLPDLSLGVACGFWRGLLGHHASEVRSQFLSVPDCTSVVLPVWRRSFWPGR